MIAWCAPMLAVVLASIGASGEVRLEARATPESVTVADTVTVTVTATAPAGWVIGDLEPAVDEGNPLGPFMVSGVVRSTPTLAPDGRMVTTFVISLEPGVPGEAQVPAFAVHGHDATGLAESDAFTKPVPVTVRSVLAGLKPADFSPGAIRPPIVPTVRRPIPIGVWIGTGAGSVIAITGGLVAIRLARRAPVRSMLEECREELDAVAVSGLRAEETAREASRIVREALGETVDAGLRFSSAGAETEILLKRVSGLDADERLTVATFLADAERVSCMPSPGADAGRRVIDGARACLAVAHQCAARAEGAR